MNSMQSPVTPRLANQRKRELLERIEATLDEIESWRKYNVAYHEDDRNFMRFLIPRGKRVLELGAAAETCWPGWSPLTASAWISVPEPSPEQGRCIPV
jgi:hypothetical protein